MVRPIKMFVGSGFGSGKQLQSWIHIKDVANLYYFIIKNQTEGIINAVAPNALSNQELTKEIATQLHRPLFLPNIPRWFMKLILGEMHILLFNNKNIIPKRAVDLGFQFQFPTAKTALKDLY
jgi:NAD dependent epimerase/dehydratase family enzyme